MFEKMRKCLDTFEENFQKNDKEMTKENRENMWYFYLDFAKAMLIDFPEVEKVARIILVEKGLFDDVKIKFSK